jgi:hypothetical protein
MTEELFATDAYRRSFDAAVVATDRDAGRVALDRTAFAVNRPARHSLMSNDAAGFAPATDR